MDTDREQGDRETGRQGDRETGRRETGRWADGQVAEICAKTSVSLLTVIVSSKPLNKVSTPTNGTIILSANIRTMLSSQEKMMIDVISLKNGDA